MSRRLLETDRNELERVGKNCGSLLASIGMGVERWNQVNESKLHRRSENDNNRRI